MFQHHAPVLLADVTDHDGWMALLEGLENREEAHVVVSLPAGGARLETELELITAALVAMTYEPRPLFCINRQVDSVALAKASLHASLASVARKGLLVKNGYYGRPDQFERWDDSTVRADWLRQGYAQGYLPELHHRVFDWVVGAGMPFYQALQMPMPLVLRLELQQWRRACAGIFEALEHAQAATEAWAWEAS